MCGAANGIIYTAADISESGSGAEGHSAVDAVKCRCKLKVSCTQNGSVRFNTVPHYTHRLISVPDLSSIDFWHELSDGDKLCFCIDTRISSQIQPDK